MGVLCPGKERVGAAGAGLLAELHNKSIHSMQYVCLAQVCAISTAIYSELLVPAL